MSELRDAAVRAIANYMHHELYDLTKTNEMLPWLTFQASAILDAADKAIEATKAHPLAKTLKG